MEKSAEDLAIARLSAAATTAVLVDELPLASRPQSVAEALALQDRLVAESGKPVAGWKVATGADGLVTFGTIYAEDCFSSPATVAADRYPPAGVEGEIAFRFLQDLPSGPPLSRDEIASMLVPFPAFEIVASRFADYSGTPPVVRLADRMSNGGMVLGEATGHPADLRTLRVMLSTDGEPVVDQNGGHSRGDPLLPVIEFINWARPTRQFSAGQFITAGTFTGLLFGKAGQRWDLAFKGLGTAQLTLS